MIHGSSCQNYLGKLDLTEMAQKKSQSTKVPAKQSASTCPCSMVVMGSSARAEHRLERFLEAPARKRAREREEADRCLLLREAGAGADEFLPSDWSDAGQDGRRAETA